MNRSAFVGEWPLPLTRVRTTFLEILAPNIFCLGTILNEDYFQFKNMSQTLAPMSFQGQKLRFSWIRALIIFVSYPEFRQVSACPDFKNGTL